MTEEITSTLRVRIGQEDAHYGGNLVAGARILQLFGDIMTEIAVITDGDEGLFVGYERVEFLAPVYAGDFIEALRPSHQDRCHQPDCRVRSAEGCGGALRPGAERRRCARRAGGRGQGGGNHGGPSRAVPQSAPDHGRLITSG